MQETSLSIIIPHYNSADLLKKLLSTIPVKEEIQILVIDDFSTEKEEEYEICKAQFPHVEFYTNECGKSAGGARNTGLKHAKGTWLLFADSDDYFLPEFYDKISAFFDDKYDIVYFTPTSIDLETEELSTRHCSYERFISRYLDNPSLKNLLGLKYSFEAPWSKMIRRKVFTDNNILFDRTMVANDTMASVKTAFYAKEILATAEKIYCITKTAHSLTATVSREKYNQRLKVYFRKHKFLKENLTRREYGLVNFKVKSRLYSILYNRLGKWFYLWTFCRIASHGVPFWRELGPYKYIWSKKN